MNQDPPKPLQATYPDSPCNDVCTLNAADVCVGCKRTLDEIVGWSSMSAMQQWTIVRALSSRKP